MTDIQTIKVIQADCLKAMAKMPAESIDCLVTDPPYGLSFMGKDWDKAVPLIDIWKECLRVLKPGAFAFIMSSPRLDCLGEMSRRIHEAGFEIGFTPIFWTYATGFPKATNVGKAVDKKLGAERRGIPNPLASKQTGQIQTPAFGDKRGNVLLFPTPVTEQAKSLEGSYAGFQPKPAVEVIIVAMKPLSENTYVDQAFKDGKGVTWLDDGRIPFAGDKDREGSIPWADLKNDTSRNTFGTYADSKGDRSRAERTYALNNPKEGRFPANLLVSDDVLNDGQPQNTGHSPGKGRAFGDGNIYGKGGERTTPEYYLSDSGSFSRYFDLDAWAQKTFPFLIVPKASTSERNEDINGDALFRQRENVDPMKDAANEIAHAYGARNAPRKNFHPTVKPVKLMAYLITLGSREGDIILDPFVGSGTTLVAARNLNRNGIGIEIDPEFAKISLERVNKLEYLDRQTKYEFEVVE